MREQTVLSMTLSVFRQLSLDEREALFASGCEVRITPEQAQANPFGTPSSSASPFGGSGGGGGLRPVNPFGDDGGKKVDPFADSGPVAGGGRAQGQ